MPNRLKFFMLNRQWTHQRCPNAKAQEVGLRGPTLLPPVEQPDGYYQR